MSDYREQRPPRASRPGRGSPAQSPARSPAAEQQGQYQQPLRSTAPQPTRGNVSFQNTELGDRQGALDNPRHRGAYLNQQSPGLDPEMAEYMDPSRVGRKKSLVRPDREKIDPGHRQWHYRSHVAQAEDEGQRVGVYPSTTGNYPQREPLRRGQSLLGREEDVHESGLSLFKRGTLRRKRAQQSSASATVVPAPNDTKRRRCLPNTPGPSGPWMIYAYVLTAWIPTMFMRTCGLRSPEQQRAWREKIALVSIVFVLMAGVGFLTFGFTEAVCGTPPNRFHSGDIENNSVIVHGFDYDFSKFKHPKAGGTFDGTTNPLFEGNFNVAGADISFMFQKVNRNCLGLITKASASTLSGSVNNPTTYFPCVANNQHGTSPVNSSDYSTTSCHTSSTAQTQFASLTPQGQVYYTWEDVKNPARNLAVFESAVIDLNLLNWFNSSQLAYPAVFDSMKKAGNPFSGRDLSMTLLRERERGLGHCLQDVAQVGFIDTNSIGCVASQVVLYVSLIFIIGVVFIKFAMAVMFSWFFSWKIGNFPRETYEQRIQRSAEIENWTDDIYRPAPSEYRPNVGKNGLKVKQGRKSKAFLPSHSRFTPSENILKGAGVGGRPTTAYGMLDSSSSSNYKRSYAPSLAKSNKPESPSRTSRSTMSFPDVSRGTFVENPCPFPLHNVVPQPPPDYEPFNFPLAHTICLVTAYSESVEGLRTTLDSIATTDYPNSHKVILIIADGMVKGAGNQMTTPEICLTMMKDLIIPAHEVEPHSYVAIADGHKRHNMAKVYAGFYDYDPATTERSKQQRIPIVLVAKCGNPLEANDSKPGNRGKRDSQIVLMAFLQKVMFDERMTTFEYEFFNSMWRVTGVSPDRYELVLCVDADTKVFPDSLTRMIACMVHDEEIMGLCGETKIANKAETFITMIQVFEYYISHHMTKAFESMFGGVTCLPGCFSMYRIKAPKGDSGYWVPILANPDIVEHYSENVVDTLHKKNLLLLGEDRYLTTLMLKTFPKRKNMFCPQAVCKTVVPDTFSVLLSQRRRWINSTVHNLSELVLVSDLCGTFCFSMQFVVAMDLGGTLVLPAAIAFTLYLVIDSIIPGGTNNTIPLVLLAVVLGIPGLLIVVTSRKFVYLGWMLIYLLSLPIWNGILPAYAFWHFDDFSWGETRKLSGVVGDNHGDKEGEFDSTNIVMKRWAEFERDRRWNSGTQSRDSNYEKKTDSNRYSLTSNSDTYHPPSGGFDSSTVDSAIYGATPRPRADSNTLVMLPAPLHRAEMGSSSTGGFSRSSDDHAYGSDVQSASNQRLIPSPRDDQYSDSHDSMGSMPPRQGFNDSASPRPRNGGNPRSSTVMTNKPLPEVVHNPFRSSTTSSTFAPAPTAYNSYTTSPTSYDEPTAFTTEPEEMPARNAARGVRLTDGGPVPGPDGVRRVTRPTGRRPTSQTPPQNTNRYSRSSTAFGNLPPGAAPPQPNPYSG